MSETLSFKTNTPIKARIDNKNIFTLSAPRPDKPSQRSAKELHPIWQLSALARETAKPAADRGPLRKLRDASVKPDEAGPKGRATGRCTSISQRCAIQIGGRCDPSTGKWEYGRNGASGNTLAFNECIGQMLAGNKK